MLSALLLTAFLSAGNPNAQVRLFDTNPPLPPSGGVALTSPSSGCLVMCNAAGSNCIGWSNQFGQWGAYDSTCSSNITISAQLMQTGVGGFLTQANLLTTGTMSLGSQAVINERVMSATWTNAMVTALGAVLSGNISVGSLPAKAIVRDVKVIINSQAAGTTTLTVSIGRTSSTFNDYIVAKSAQVAANTVYGAVSGDRGTNLTGFDLPSYTGQTVVNAQFISTGTNLNTVTTCTGTVDIFYEMAP